MDQLVELIIKGNVVKVPQHMVADYEKFGATKTRKIIKEAPIELLKFPIKKDLLPEMEVNPLEIIPVEVKTVEAKAVEVIPVEVKERKKPVRSKTK